MAHVQSNVASVRIDNSTSSITDISGSVNTVSIDGGNASVQDTGIGDARHTEVNDIKPIQTISMNGWLDTTSEAIIMPLIEGTTVLKTVEVKLLSGQYISGEARIGTVSHSLPVGLQTWSMELRGGDTTGFIRTSVASS